MTNKTEIQMRTSTKLFDEARERKIWLNRTNKFLEEFNLKERFKLILKELEIDYININNNDH